MAASPTIGVVANPPAAVVRQPPGLLLSGIAGYVDAAGYLALYGLFTAHVTGNLVTAGSALARSATEGVGPKLTMLPVFMSAVGATTLLIRWLHRKGIAPLVPLLALMTGALALFFLTGVCLRAQVTSADSAALIAIGAAGVLSMGIQNGLMRQVLGTIAPTTMMTGNLTQFTIDLVEFGLPTAMDAKSRAAAKQRLAKVGWPLLGFVAGAALGSALTKAFSFWSLSVPTAIAAALTIQAALAPAKA